MPRCSFNSALKNCQSLQRKYKENRINSRGKFTGNLLYCFHTAGVLHIFALYNLLGPGPSFYRKSKINIKRNPNYEIGWFNNWPIIISHRLYAFHFTNDNYKSNDVFYSQNSYYKVYLKALKIRNCNG